MGTFPIKIAMPITEYPEIKDLLGVKVEPPKFNAADVLSDFYKRSWKLSTDLGKSVHETLERMNNIFNGEGDKSDMKNYEVDRIIFNPPATIVFWKDGTKTVVKCHEDQDFNPYYGFCAALAKKVYKSNSAVNRMVDKYVSEMAHDVAKKVNTGNTNGDNIDNTPKKNSRNVNSLDDDYIIGRFCDTCKYRHYRNSNCPCRDCIHTGRGRGTGISYWTEQEDK